MLVTLASGGRCNKELRTFNERELIQDFDSSSQINVNWLNSGLYILKVETASGIHLLKFIKE